MKSEKFKTNIVSSDVLIIGGSLAGLCAGVKIKELHENTDVLVVDKGGIGWAGLVPTGGGHLSILAPDANLDEWVEWVAERGDGLSNIEWLYNFGGSLYDSIKEVFDWGLSFMKDNDGNLYIDDVPKRRIKNKMTGFITHKVLLELKKILLAKKVKLMNKIEMVDLLTYDGRVVGAVGFSIFTGEFYVFKARATLIAAGAARYKNRRFWTMNCGEMVAAAYRAGSRHLNSEFGTIHANCSKECETWVRGAGHQDALQNAIGEGIMSKHFPGMTESFSRTAYAMVKEVDAGLGPIYFDVTKDTKQYDTEVLDPIHHWTRLHGGFFNGERILTDKAGINLRRQKVEWIPGFIGGLGNIQVDLDCKSPDMEGLWAAGDTIKTGIDMEGAVAPGEQSGWGLSLAIVTGLKAGKNIAKYIPDTTEPLVNFEEQQRLKKSLYAPMGLVKGIEPFAAVLGIQKAIVPAKYIILRNGERLKESLRLIEEIQNETLPNVKAENPHELLKYCEARSMALCAEMTQRAALYRTESRGSHLREDYPQRDDENWLVWTVIEDENGRMKLSKKPVPKANNHN